jgi:uncharacterized membrane protein YbhN (UPF0104 family)
MTAPATHTARRLRLGLALLLQLGCIVYVGSVLWEQRAELARALDVRWDTLLALVGLVALAHAERAYEVTFTLERLGVHEPFGEGFLLTGAAFLLNHLPFNAGLVVRAAVLKHDHSLPYTSYASLTMVTALANVGTAALLSLIAIAVGPPSATALPVIGLLVAVLFGALLLVSLPSSWTLPGDNFVSRRFRLLMTGISLIRGNGSGILWLSLLSAGKVIGIALRLWLCFGALNAPVSPVAVLLLASANVVLTIVNLTPGNLGLREMVLALISSQLGTTQMIGMAAATLDRAVSLPYTILIGLPGIYALRRRGPFRALGGARAPSNGDPKSQ